MKELTEDDFVFIPIPEATAPPKGFIEHLENRWWSTHPAKGLAFYNPKKRNGRRSMGGYGSPQCNPNEAMTRRRAQGKPWDVEVVFLPSVFVKVDIYDYMDR